MKKFKKFLKTVSTLIVVAFAIYYVLEENGYINKTSYAKEETKEVIFKENSQDLKIYYFDVGQADSTLIIANNNTMLIDAGNNNDGMLLVNYIKSLGIKKIDFAIGTHAHEDHIGGMDDIIDNFEIGTFFMPDAITTTTTFEDVLDALERKNLRFNTPDIGKTISLGDGSFKVLSYGSDASDLNDTSIVVKLVYGNYSYLFMGDATSKVEKTLLNNNTDLKSDVLKLRHHGSNYSNTNDFLGAVNPKYAIISVGKNNSYGHPSKSVINRLKKKNIDIYRTDQMGTILLTSDKVSINIETINTMVDGG